MNPISIPPHCGSLCQVYLTPPSSSDTKLQTSAIRRCSNNYIYTITILIEQQHNKKLELQYTKEQYDFLFNLFTIVNIEHCDTTTNKNTIHKDTLRIFCYLRCPVFQRRDDEYYDFIERQRKKGCENEGKDLEDKNSNGDDENEILHQPKYSSTFEEVWDAVSSCCGILLNNSSRSTRTGSSEITVMGLEGFMVFCRFIVLTQYQEARQRFDCESSSQTQTNAATHKDDLNDDNVFVDVPSPYNKDDPPKPINSCELASFEREMKNRENIQSHDDIIYGYCGLLPELELDHSQLFKHDDDNNLTCRSKRRRRKREKKRPMVKIEVFGMSHYSSSYSSTSPSPSSQVEMKPTLDEYIIRYFSSTTHNTTATAEIQSSSSSIVVKRSYQDMKWLNDTFESQRCFGGVLCGRIFPPFPPPPSSFTDHKNKTANVISSVARSAARSLLLGKNRWSSSSTTPTESSFVSSPPTATTTRAGGGNCAYLTAESRLLERYINYLLEHPSLSTSFPLHVILKANQTGLDCAKNLLDHYYTTSTTNPITNHGCTTTSTSSKVTPNESNCTSSSATATTINKCEVNKNSNKIQMNLSWVRTAAQAALALKLHGILETTGHPSASARLLHASLPYFTTSSTTATMPTYSSTWCGRDGTEEIIFTGRRGRRRREKNIELDPNNDIDSDHHDKEGDDEDDDDLVVCEFEKGVVNIKSELGQPGLVEDVLDEDVKNCDEVGANCSNGQVATGSSSDNDDILDSCDGYDMLPTPMPLSERSVLCAGSRRTLKTISSPPRRKIRNIDNITEEEKETGITLNTNQSLEEYTCHVDHHRHHPGKQQQKQSYYHYCRNDSTVLGDVSVDNDIERLRTILKSLDDTLGRCLMSTLMIEEGVRERTKLHVSILGALDSCGFVGGVVGGVEGIGKMMKGGIFEQRALLQGVSGLEGGLEIIDWNAVKFGSDLSWNKSLASSAVSAAEEVSKAVNASRNASRAKIAAAAAVKKAQLPLDRFINFRSSSLNKDKKTAITSPSTRVTKKDREHLNALQTQASNAQINVMRAAVVDHGAATAKRRAAMALAHDVRCWNVHRKREIGEACLLMGNAQRDAASEYGNAWLKLRDGLVDALSSFPVIRIESRIDYSTPAVVEDNNGTPASAVVIENASSNFILTEQQDRDENKDRKEPLIVLSAKEKKENIDVEEHNFVMDHFASPTVDASSMYNEDVVRAEDVITCKTEEFDKVDVSDLGRTQEKGLGIERESIRILASSIEERSMLNMYDFAKPPQLLSPPSPPVSLVHEEPLLDLLAVDQNLESNEHNDLHENQEPQQPPPLELLCMDRNIDLKKTEISMKKKTNTSSSSVINETTANMELQLNPSTEYLKQSDIISDFIDLRGTSQYSLEISPTNSNTPSDTVYNAEGKGDTTKLKVDLLSCQEDAVSCHKNNRMTESMQSLVDDLIMWGGQWDSEDDLSLPLGLSASLAMDESGILR